MKVSMVDGTSRISSIRGTYPVKKTGGLMSTWISHNVGFHGSDGFFSLIPSKIDPELGVILRLNTIHFDPAPTGMKACIEVSAKGKGWMIQFPSDEEREKWVSVLATTSTSKKGSTTGGAGTTAQSGSPLRAAPSGKIAGTNSQNALG
ncbi:hypothetical protein BCR44DRAFT_65547 [Catenaria anguillulae PL171]|uniref:PH domain-containing protein n=1 Tax=Catenaria anguillulae PL171 TaxID=765915 RepID=A0A1Y2HWH0_9FUNG|nr:hypothetical protein BCR44DRAFT_65547 [Catenaria anguillulae PL171]